MYKTPIYTIKLCKYISLINSRGNGINGKIYDPCKLNKRTTKLCMLVNYN